ncbi:class II glutamine amidotransferase [Herbaspirillum rubrisubalbicans]|uniref:Class II glutamine amidotransferase n=1 Tax=Herbaspirillum rubrisubalbicans TaxID=80842 RepID=A0AAD0XJS2_9BURK|nr:class II glutamine amidotransferase [Herbaspirillum rubrisubalbicans]ALU91895.1 glutamine amidotransferase protein [Herbaspirillum rubrisubalbicans M1]AYR26873.1 class II glutamine amidotransferase [Herbaspirillum rubrisubalbicans]
MCQLLGMNCNTPTDIVFSFTGFATRGGLTDHHRDGWGIAFFEGSGVRTFVDHQAAVDSPVAALIKRYPIKSQHVIAHIRKATQGRVTLANCHPFVRELWGRYWVFAHNGDLKNFTPTLDGPFRPVGTTDSELSFCYILQELRRRFGDTLPLLAELRAALREIVDGIASHGTFNMLLSDGSALFTHCSTNLYYIVRQHPFTTAKLSDEDLSVDFSEVTTSNDRVAVIVTQPLTDNEVWTQYQPGEMKLFVDGTVVD